MKNSNILVMKQDKNGKFNLPQQALTKEIRVIELIGENVLYESKVLNFLQELVKINLATETKLIIKSTLKNFSSEFISTLQSFKYIEAQIEINDVFERYDFLYKNWDNLVENLSLLSLSVQNAQNPQISMLVNLTALNSIYIDEILRFYYTDLMQLFPFIETNILINYRAFPKFLSLDYMPEQYKGLVLKELKHFLAAEDEGYTRKDQDNFDELEQILSKSQFNPEFFKLASNEILKTLKASKNAFYFIRLKDFLIKHESSSKNFKKLIELMNDDEAFKYFKQQNALFYLSQVRKDNISLREKIFDQLLISGNKDQLEKDLYSFASNPKTKDIYPKILKKLINKHKEEGTLKEIQPYILNLYDIDKSEKHAELLLQSELDHSNYSKLNYFTNLLIAHNPQNKLAVETKNVLRIKDKFLEIRISLDNTYSIRNKNTDEEITKEILKSKGDDELLKFLNHKKTIDGIDKLLEITKSYGWDCMVRNQNQRAKIIFSFLENNCHDFDVYKTMGDINSANQDFAKAISSYQKAIELSPNDIYILKQLGWRHYDNNDPDKGAEIFKKVLEIEPENQDALVTLGLN